MDRKQIQEIINKVHDLFTYGREVDSPTIAKLDEKLWKDFAKQNLYKYDT